VDRAKASSAALHALTGGSGATAAAVGETVVPADSETVPCPQFEYPFGVRVTPCPNCGSTARGGKAARGQQAPRLDREETGASLAPTA
jgi:hypothetical protein